MEAQEVSDPLRHRSLDDPTKGKAEQNPDRKMSAPEVTYRKDSTGSTGSRTADPERPKSDGTKLHSTKGWRTLFHVSKFARQKSDSMSSSVHESDESENLDDDEYAIQSQYEEYAVIEKLEDEMNEDEEDDEQGVFDQSLVHIHYESILGYLMQYGLYGDNTHPDDLQLHSHETNCLMHV
ncbi:hypothetical protein CAPTEDRAFT_213483 [Capitella teleta]|uniref:Uncharacterized protein n=1 Tax=Capitella teleta TaxID=283909 RepID=R7TSK5_CAPTE|nr:hypothetical protein CAPTEDRAFT_213483 [Capitella teleta]|eukprot:ELT94466.1 hypothetical protein CAPTEDRAFT_213483 [Capitella teleta]